jgi:N-acetylglucosamine-6-phosphate deacetylase
VFGLDDQLGRLAPGYAAYAVLLNAALEVPPLLPDGTSQGFHQHMYIIAL